MSSSNGSNPVMRKNNLITTTTGSDQIVYDRDNNSVHTLSSSVSDVWLRCDGTRSAAMIAAETGLPIETVQMALQQLMAVSLITGHDKVSSPSGSRRRLLKRAGMGATVAIPVIVSVTAPAAADVSSRCAAVADFYCFDYYCACEMKVDCCPVNGYKCTLTQYGAKCM